MRLIGIAHFFRRTHLLAPWNKPALVEDSLRIMPLMTLIRHYIDDRVMQANACVPWLLLLWMVCAGLRTRFWYFRLTGRPYAVTLPLGSVFRGRQPSDLDVTATGSQRRSSGYRSGARVFLRRLLAIGNSGRTERSVGTLRPAYDAVVAGHLFVALDFTLPAEDARLCCSPTPADLPFHHAIFWQRASGCMSVAPPCRRTRGEVEWSDRLPRYFRPRRVGV